MSKKTPLSIKGQVGALVREARKVKKAPEYITAKDVMPVITELRAKGLSWKETHSWLHERGITITQQSLGNAFRKARIRRERT